MQFATAYSEEFDNDYFVGLIKLVEGGALVHVDFAPMDAIGYEVDKVVHQLAWNLFLTQPQSGGECVVYDSAWCKEHEGCKIQDSYGYPRQLVRGEKRFEITPTIGDVVIFNCRNYHEVKSISGDRITVGSFLGQLSDQNNIMWS